MTTASIKYYLVFTFLLLIGTAGNAGPVFGANGRPVGTDYPMLFRTMRANGLVRARVDAALTWDNDATAVPNMQAIVAAAKANGIQLECILHTGFTWGDRTDHGLYPAGDATALYNQGFNRTFNFVSQFVADIPDWELANEVNLLNLDSSGQRLYGKGTTAAEFNTPIMNDWSHVLKGMSDAIDRVNVAHGSHLRRIVGTTSSMFGYLDFMLSKGVKMDVLGYHYYESNGVDPYHYWWLINSAGFDLFAKMASYGRPVHVNEMNCAEIYNASYTNVIGSALMNTCNTNLSTMLKTFSTQSEANIEAILLYEMLDEPAKAAPENHFGLLYTISSPKPMLATVASFAKAAIAKPSIVFPATINLKVGVSAAVRPSSVVNVSGSLECQGVLLPPGLTMDYNTCTISGTPTTAGVNVSTLVFLSTGGVQVVQFTVQP